MNVNPILAWMQEHIAYWERERQMAKRALLQSPVPGELTRAEQRMRKMLATRFLNQLAELEKEVSRERE